MDLQGEFQRIRREHKAAMIQTAARAVLGSSVIRVFRAGTKDELQRLFRPGYRVKEVSDLANGQHYDGWFAGQLTVIAKEIKRVNPGNGRIFPGYKWGHAAKC